MKCAQCQSIIDDIGDMDRLPNDAARHVSTCAACERFGVELLALRSLLREPARVTAPETFEIGLARRLREARSTPPSRLAVLWSLRPQTSLAAAAAFLMVCSGALVVSRYAASPESLSNQPIIVATNKATNSVALPVDVPVFPQPAESGPESAGLQTVAALPSNNVRVQRAGGRTRMTGHSSNSDDAMLLVSDESGSRLVNVPGVLIGSEMIVPIATGDGGDSPETVSF